MMEMDQETVYGTHEDSHVVMSEKVQSLAGSVYQEFERMISKYDEDVVKDLMPLVVNVLECLDLSYTENQEHEVELELLREDNEQLVTQYEREKQLRKGSEQKLLELEDVVEEDRKDTIGKIESLESIVRMLELKSKNSSDHVNRLEEKESEMKKEYSKLHERYTELFKTHMDYMERTKILMGTDRLEQMGMARHRLSSGSMGGGGLAGGAGLVRSTGPVSFGFASLEGATTLKSMGGSPIDFGSITSPGMETSQSNTSLKNELKETEVPVESSERAKVGRETMDKGQLTDELSKETRATATSMGDGTHTHSHLSHVEGGWVDNLSPDSPEELPQELEEVEELASSSTAVGPAGRTTKQKEQRSGNTLYQELSFQDSDVLGEVDEGADITGGWVHPGEYSSSDSDDDEGAQLRPLSVNDNFFGMGKEVENLIMENNELLATKNALNIVKDDLIAKVDELTSEHEILREEIKSLQAVKTRMRQRIEELEDDLKRLKEEVEKSGKGGSGKSDDEEDVPMAQRKRFTRVEMARVLMERNQYKERFMELQEAVRWTEMIRASRIDPSLDKKSKQSIWKFFSNLFSTSEKPQRKPLPYVNMRYNAPTHHVSPALDTMRKRSLADRKRGFDILDGDASSSEKLQQRRANERREQYRQVRAHVRKDDGRMQAYGWSLPAKASPGGLGSSDMGGGTGGSSSKGVRGGEAGAGGGVSVPVPVPVYCRPLMEKEPGMRIWCAAGVNLSGGRTRDGGSIVGASIFYSNPDEEKENSDIVTKDEVEKLNNELKEGDKVRREGEELEQQLSSLVWICTSTHSVSKVTIIDANNPADVLESFRVCSSHLLCISSVPGAKESDYPVDEELNKLVVEESNRESLEEASVPEVQESNNNNNDDSCGNSDSNREKESNKEEPAIGSITFVSCVTGGSSSRSPSPAPESPEKEPEEMKPVLRKETANLQDQDLVEDFGDEVDSSAAPSSPTPPPRRRFLREPEGMVKDGLLEIPRHSEHVYGEVEKMSSVLATVWLGSQSGAIYVHSAVSQWKRCLHSIRLKDSVLSIVHLRGRVLAALADGTVAIFHRASDGQWDLTNYHLLDLGRPFHSIRCMAVVHSKVWCGYRNRIHIVDPRTMSVEKSFDAHPRKESQVRQMAWVGDGVWVSIRLDSTLRLFHAHTHQHLQDVDIEPYVSKMLALGAPAYPKYLVNLILREKIIPYPSFPAKLTKSNMEEDTMDRINSCNPSLYDHLTSWHLLDDPSVFPGGTGKLGFSFVRITGLLISSNRLWIGTGNGVIISVPLSETIPASTSSPAALTSSGSSPGSSSTPGASLGATSSTVPAALPAPPPIPRLPGSVVRVYSDGQDKVTPGSFIPYCSMAQAQLSFHGHRDAVKFFVAVPGSGGMSAASSASVVTGAGGSSGEEGASMAAMAATGKRKPKSMLVISGGEGYIDFRIGDGEDDEAELDAEVVEKPRPLSKGDRSHLVVWQVTLPD